MCRSSFGSCCWFSSLAILISRSPCAWYAGLFLTTFTATISLVSLRTHLKT
jgi:hypothetical protein